jgi:tRNA A37 threonylcarbamoyltransferase TsaD
MKILAIESSCDETAAAVIEDGRKILSSVVDTQIATHALYGGVVPEIASRRHMEAVVRVTEQALRLSDKRVIIPMKGRAESLNAGVAAAIVIYEMTK